MSALVLVVAGHDPSGGAGVDADRQTLEHHGVRSSCVVTAWTEQDGTHVRGLTPRPAVEWLEEARLALGGEEAGTAQAPSGLKSGLLPNAEAVRALATLLDEARLGRADFTAVVDPVLAATAGEVFLDSEGIAALLAEILPRDVVLTPNLPEAARLTGMKLSVLQAGHESRLEAARALLARGARAIVLKGGHASDDPAVDLLLERDAEPRWFAHRRLPGAHLHGSGCRFASSLAAHLALGETLPTATASAASHLAALFQAGRGR